MPLNPGEALGWRELSGDSCAFWNVRIEAGFLDAADVAIGPAPQQDHPVCQGRSGIGEEGRRHPLPAYGRVTPFADTHKGNRPSFSDAAPPAEAEPLYER
ncbi:MAG: hypothetical protein E6G36_13935, partial [Actinobacteria bacterium]